MSLPAGLPRDVELRLIKAPLASPVARRDPAVSAKVSEMLLRIEREGMDAAPIRASLMTGRQETSQSARLK